MPKEKQKGDLASVATLSILALTIAIVAFLIILSRNFLKQYDYIGRTDQQIYTITIDGKGEITATPDIAEVTLGIETTKPSVAAAQKENNDKMNQLIDQIKAMDVKKEDIKTSQYNIYPRYDYTNGRQNLIGYIVSQAVTVKIRNLENVSAILELGGQNGVNQLSGLNFTIDEPESLKQQAREEALQNAKEKAEALARSAGVKLGKLVSFSESYSGAPSPMPYYAGNYAREEKAVAMDASAPSVEPGSQDVIIYVTVTYEVL